MAAASIRRAPRSVANMLASGAHFGGLLVANCSVTVPGMEATVELQCWWRGGKPWEQLLGKERVRGNGPVAARPSPGHAAGVHVGGVRTRLEADDACMLAQYAGPFFVPGCLLDCQHRTRVRALGNTDGVRLGPHH
jgi:hypothetical protein